MSLSDITPQSPSPAGSPATMLLMNGTTTATNKTAGTTTTTTRHNSSTQHESSLPTPETAHPTSTQQTISPSWNHTNTSIQKLPPPASLNPPSRTVLPPVIRPQQDHHLTSPYSPFTPIASPAPPSHAALLQKNRDLEIKIASLEEEKASQAETLNGVIHDLEVENRLLRSLVADSQRLHSSDYSFTRSSQPTESPM
ncbi:hypothetical protein BC941DRAFT_450431 [Chlamydoabsidia padenii]|nr:hypothetical protein BC941DRAFT_450431 [Chlamydoabsidia padenii]